ncbi:MAG: DUF721 domain-containing protein [Nitrospina sp.]|jgi:predicted nucleic acid-binding Zn ribbon protein|nr:DUF721 domain-containing protein [Nitrospina sp.]MBT4556282.1 DUF721 domain-containing protein [Nitrospina sp.]MBT5632128.1 DUF721 domain-containing protein [Nitrospina sp.]
MDRKLGRNANRNWSEIRSVLFQALPQEIFANANQSEWLTYHWNLVVGKEIARVSTIDNVTRKILYVKVKGKEWVPILDSLKKNIIQEINSRAGEPLLNRIVFKTVA